MRLLPFLRLQSSRPPSKATFVCRHTGILSFLSSYRRTASPGFSFRALSRTGPVERSVAKPRSSEAFVLALVLAIYVRRATSRDRRDVSIHV